LLPFNEPAFLTACLGVALCAAAAIAGVYLWRQERSEPYLLFWTLAWTFNGARWVLYYLAQAQPALHAVEVGFLAAATSMGVLGAHAALPRRRRSARTLGAALALLFAVALGGGLAAGAAAFSMYMLAIAQGLAIGALLLAGWRATRLTGYLVLVLIVPAWALINAAFILLWGQSWRHFVFYPLIVLPMMMGFLMVAFQRSRQRALDAERKLNRIFDTAPVPLIVAAYPRGEVEQCNQAMLDLTGLSAEQLHGRTGEQTGVLPDREGARKVFDELRAGRTVHGRELLYELPSGRRTLAVNAATVELEDGPRFIFALHDLTRLRELEAQARASLEKFTALFETNPVGIVVVDLSGNRVIEINDAALYIGGFTREHAFATPANAMIRWLDREEQRRRHAVLKDGRILHNAPGSFIRADGRTVHVLISGVMLRLDERAHLILTYHDVSEQRRAEAAVQEMNALLEARVAERTALLEQANRDLEGFSYSVAHDLRAPLRAIAGFSALLEEDCKDALPPGGSHSLARISAAALRMSSLLDGLLEFARTGRAEIELSAVDMRALAAEALAEMPEVAQGRVQVQLDPLPAGRGDTLLLRQVWRNLIENACKFSRDGQAPRLHIGARALPPPHPSAEPVEPAAPAGEGHGGAGARTEYFVRDNGVGFDMEHAAKLFGVFHRLHHEAQFEGTGVGLAIVQRIVHRHGGHIHAEAAPGQGATFYFSLGE